MEVSRKDRTVTYPGNIMVKESLTTTELNVGKDAVFNGDVVLNGGLMINGVNIIDTLTEISKPSEVKETVPTNIIPINDENSKWRFRVENDSLYFEKLYNDEWIIIQEMN